MKRFTVSRDAQADLDSIWDYIATDNPAAADRHMDAIRERFSLLGDQPRMGEARPDIAPNIRHSLVGNYLILYRPRNDGVDVLRIIHGSRDVPAVFRDRGK